MRCSLNRKGCSSRCFLIYSDDISWILLFIISCSKSDNLYLNPLSLNPIVVRITYRWCIVKASKCQNLFCFFFPLLSVFPLALILRKLRPMSILCLSVSVPWFLRSILKLLLLAPTFPEKDFLMWAGPIEIRSLLVFLLFGVLSNCWFSSYKLMILSPPDMMKLFVFLVLRDWSMRIFCTSLLASSSSSSLFEVFSLDNCYFLLFMSIWAFPSIPNLLISSRGESLRFSRRIWVSISWIV